MTTRFNIADRLGLINQQIAELQAEQKRLKAQVVAEGHPEIGNLYQAVPLWNEVDRVDWKAVAIKLNPSRQLLQAHTKHQTVVQVRVTEIREEAA